MTVYEIFALVTGIAILIVGFIAMCIKPETRTIDDYTKKNRKEIEQTKRCLKRIIEDYGQDNSTNNKSTQ